jgi:hypothetical protein
MVKTMRDHPDSYHLFIPLTSNGAKYLKCFQDGGRDAVLIIAGGTALPFVIAEGALLYPVMANGARTYLSIATEKSLEAYWTTTLAFLPSRVSAHIHLPSQCLAPVGL